MSAGDELADVYTQLVALRRTPDDRPPRERCQAIAAVLPGALRILDRMPLSELESRAELLARGERAHWVDATLAWMDVMREALPVRATIRPPGGRLVPWALAKAGERIGLPAGQVEILVFGAAAVRRH